MKLSLDCKQAYYNAKMQIMCRKINDTCAHQYFKRCKGWCVLTDEAKQCPLRKES